MNGRLGGTEARRRAAIVEHARAVVDVEVAAFAGQLGHEEVFVAVVVEVAGVDAHAGLGLARRRAARRPTSSAAFSNVPLRWFIQSWFSLPSLAT